jgi:uncharacterized protein (TIGR02117 family)
MSRKFFITLSTFFILISINVIAQSNDSTNHDVYVINYSWHTGLVFEISEQTIDMIPALKDFKDFDYVDIGWGDEEFYQHPDTNWVLAAKAILVPTPSVIRIAGFKGNIETAQNWSQFFIKFEMKNSEFSKLCRFVEETFLKSRKNQFIVSLRKADSQIIFYKSNLSYHLLNTCNTWIANALKASGLDISTSCISTEQDLFDAIKEKGKVIVPSE